MQKYGQSDFLSNVRFLLGLNLKDPRYDFTFGVVPLFSLTGHCRNKMPLLPFVHVSTKYNTLDNDRQSKNKGENISSWLA